MGRRRTGKDRSGRGNAALAKVEREVCRLLKSANGGRSLRILGREDVRHMVDLLRFSTLGVVREDAAKLGIDLAGLDAGIDDAPFAVAVGNQRFVTLSMAGFVQHGWAYPDSWKLPMDPPCPYLGERVKPIRGRTLVTKALLVVDREAGMMTLGAGEFRADAFCLPWTEIQRHMHDLADEVGVGPRVEAPEAQDSAALELLMPDGTYDKRLGVQMRRDLIEIHENAPRMELIRRALVLWSRSRGHDKSRFRIGAGELLAVTGSPG